MNAELYIIQNLKLLHCYNSFKFLPRRAPRYAHSLPCLLTASVAVRALTQLLKLLKSVTLIQVCSLPSPICGVFG